MLLVIDLTGDRPDRQDQAPDPSGRGGVGAADPAQPRPGQVADLAGHLVGVEVVAPLDEAAAGALVVVFLQKWSFDRTPLLAGSSE